MNKPIPRPSPAGPQSVPAPLARRSRPRIDWARLNYILIPTPKRISPRQKPRTLEEIIESLLPQTFVRFCGRPLRFLLRIAYAITPEGRNVFVAALVVAGFGVDVAHTQVYVLFCALAALLFGSIVASRWLKLPPLAFAVAAKGRVFVGDIAIVSAECTVFFGDSAAGARATDSKCAIGPFVLGGPFLPYFARWTQRLGRIDTAIPGTTARSEGALRITRRGVHMLGAFRLSQLVPLGLASGPYVESTPVRIVVVPRPLEIGEVHAQCIRLARGSSARRSTARGASEELRSLRMYAPGDPIRAISARASARAGVPVVRENEREQAEHIALVICAGGETGDEDVEVSVELAAGIARDFLALGKRIRLAPDLAPAVVANFGVVLDALAAYEPEVSDPVAADEAAAAAALALASDASLALAVVIKTDRSRTSDAVVEAFGRRHIAVLCIDVYDEKLATQSTSNTERDVQHGATLRLSLAALLHAKSVAASTSMAPS